MTVIDISTERIRRHDHLEGNAVCLACKHEWIAIAAPGTLYLNCPACSLDKGVFQCGVYLPRHWQCNCGNATFFINPDEFRLAICCYCGMGHSF